MRCTVCNHTLVDDINLAILSGDYTLDELSQNFGPSRSAFHRHGRHLEKKMRRTLERLENHRKQVSLFKLSAFLDHVQIRVEAAAADGDTDRVYKGSHIGCRLIHQINKMDVPLEPDTAYRLLSSPDLVSRDSILPQGPETIAELHQALRDKTMAPCPPNENDEDDEAAENQAENRPDLEKELLQLLDALETKSRLPKTAKAARQNQHLLRQKLRQEKHLLNGKNLPKKPSATQAPDHDENVGREKHPQGGEAQAPPAVQEPTPLPCISNPEIETVLLEIDLLTDPWPLTPDHCFSDPCTLTTDHCSVPPDHSPADASPPATASANKRDKCATNAKRQRRLLRKMLRNQKDIFKAKKLVQNFTAGRQNAASAAAPETFPPADAGLPESATPPALTNPSSLIPFPCRSNPELETVLPEIGLLTDPCPQTPDHCPPNPWLSPGLDPWLSPDQRPCPSDPGLPDPPADYLDTRNSELETVPALPETANQKPGTKPPPPYDETAARADELFEISHGYKRGHPPKPIPDRRRDEDFRSRSVFGDLKNFLPYI